MVLSGAMFFAPLTWQFWYAGLDFIIRFSSLAESGAYRFHTLPRKSLTLSESFFRRHVGAPLREHDGQVRFRKAVFAADKQAGHEKFHVVGKRKMNLCQKQQMMKFFVFQKKPFVFGPADKPVGHLNCGICSRTSHFQFPSPLTEYKYKTLI